MELEFFYDSCRGIDGVMDVPEGELLGGGVVFVSAGAVAGGARGGCGAGGSVGVCHFVDLCDDGVEL